MDNITKEEMIKRIPSYLYPYMGIQSNNLSGFWDSLWSGVKTGAGYVWSGAKTAGSYIGTGIEKGWSYAKEGASWSWDKVKQLYNKLFTYQNDHSKITENGAKEIANSNAREAAVKAFNHAKTQTSNQSVWSKIGNAVGSVVGRVANDVAQYGAQVYAQKLKQKIAKAAKVTGQNENEIYQKALAWSIQHQDQLKQMGFNSPEAAATAVLEHNNGMPPSANETPMQVFGSTKAGILGDINPMMLVLAGLAIFAFMENKKDYDKHNG